MDVEDILYALVPPLSEFGVDPRVPKECRTFIAKLINSLEGSESARIKHVVEQAPRLFRCLNGLPDWIQNPEWQFSDGLPMLFVGQIETKSPSGGQDSVFFLFWNPDNGETKVVHQMY